MNGFDVLSFMQGQRSLVAVVMFSAQVHVLCYFLQRIFAACMIVIRKPCL